MDGYAQDASHKEPAKELTSKRMGIPRIVPDPKEPQKFLLEGYGFLCTANLSWPIPDTASSFLLDHTRAFHVAAKYGKHGWNKNHQKGGNFTVRLRYNSVLYTGRVGKEGGDTLVVIKHPKKRIQQGLLGALV